MIPPPWIFPTVVTYFQSGDFGSTLGENLISCSTSSASQMAELEVAMNDDDDDVNETAK